MIGLLIYSNTFSVPFIFDDEASIAGNHVIKNLRDFILEGSGYRYNPRRFIGYLTFALNYRFGGLDVTGYHVFNLCVHILTALLVYLLARLTLATPFFRNAGERTSLIPFFAALLFVSHPVQTQAVTYIVQRLASLATMFYLLSLVGYIKGRLVAVDSGRSFSPRPLACYALALIAGLAAMRTKEISFTLPLVIVLFEFFFFQGSRRKKLLFLLPVLLLLGLAPLSLVGADMSPGTLFSDLAERTRLQTDMPRTDYLFTQFRVIVTYLRLLVFPVHQNLDYDYPVYSSFFTPQVLLSFLFILALFTLAVYLVHRSRPGAAGNPGDLPELRLISFGILWFFITLSVESSVIPIVDVIYEHRLYLPSAGVFLAASTLVALLLRRCRQKRVLAGVGVLILVMGGATFARNSVWGDSLTLAQDIVRKSPGVPRAHYNFALALHDAGRSEEALREAAVAAKLDREDARPWNLIGTIVAQMGRQDDAIEAFALALELYPDAPYTHLNLATAYMAKGVTDRAMEHFSAAVRLDPGNPEIYNKMGKAYSGLSRNREAIESFEHAVALDPNRPEYRFNLQQATRALQTGSGLKPRP